MEEEKSSTPKNFQLKCIQCGWARTSSGLTTDLSDLIYIKPSCKGCGRYRKYKCPKCGAPCPLKRIKGNR